MRIAVIGGGPAGMMAAYAASSGGNVTLFEKNEKLGKKLFLTGKGRCNITNARGRDDFFSNIPNNPKFLYSAFSRLSNDDLIALLNRSGLETAVERGQRVFPASGKSSDVIRTLEAMLRNSGVTVRLNTPVEDIILEDGAVRGLMVKGRTEAFDKVIFASGGASYPTTGSDGSGYDLMKKAGHTVTDIHPSLIPLVCREKEMVRDLSGLSLRNVEVSFYERGKLLYRDRGEMLFTHFGLSGPLILSASAHIRDYGFNDSVISIDMKPALYEEQLNQRLLRDFSEEQNILLRNALVRLVPRNLAPYIMKYAGIPESRVVNSISREERKNLVRALKDFRLKITDTRPLAEAIITRGGVSLKEIDPRTMESRIVKGLYLAGEVLDIDAYTGGYNLQIAFSTGYLAGISALN